MTELRYDVLGIGNAIVDVIAQADEEFIARLGIVKGTMTLIDAERAEALYAMMGPAVEMSGGSEANTIVGVASFGGKAAFIGKVADDDFGRIFGHDIRAAGVAFETPPAKSGSAPTARSHAPSRGCSSTTGNDLPGRPSGCAPGHASPSSGRVCASRALESGYGSRRRSRSSGSGRRSRTPPPSSLRCHLCKHSGEGTRSSGRTRAMS